ncbi:MAG: glutamate racemase [Elusimicrobiota bacterium]|jgi:glutamate racemase|nr:glutamate racemase [Elusimicrobiota bacterium]
MKQDDRAIGIFDSGLGGLTILKEVHALLPRENLIYFGDTAHVPYGSKSKETVTEYSLNIARFLESKKVKLIIIACNTASALALSAVKKHTKAPVLGVISPGAKCAVNKNKGGKVAVLGTEATVKSKAYVKEIAKLDKKTEVKQYACPLFVPVIEEGILNGELLDLVINKYLAPLKKMKPAAVILGCTHYPVIKKHISRILGGKTLLVDSAEETAKEAKKLLTEKGLLKQNGKGKIEIYASDSPARFSKLAVNIIGGKKPKVKENRFYI